MNPTAHPSMIQLPPIFTNAKWDRRKKSSKITNKIIHVLYGASRCKIKNLNFNQSDGLRLSRWRWWRWRWRCATGAPATATAVVLPRPHGEEHNQQDNHNQDDNTVTGPLAAADLVLTRRLELLCSACNERIGSCHLALDVVELLSLSLDQDSHVEEHLVEFLEVPLQFFDGLVALANLGDGVQNSTSALLLDRLLKEGFALAGGDEQIYGFFVGIFAGDGEVAALDGFAILGGDLVADGGEGVHGVPELLAKTVDDGCAGVVGGRTGAASGETAVGGVGAIEGFEAELDELGLLESEGDVRVHPRSELLDGVGVVESLALLVSVVELLLQGLHLSEFLLDGFDIFEELVEIDTRG